MDALLWMLVTRGQIFSWYKSFELGLLSSIAIHGAALIYTSQESGPEIVGFLTHSQRDMSCAAHCSPEGAKSWLGQSDQGMGC